MSVKMLNKNIPNNGVKEAGRNQATTNKTPLNADNEDNVMVLGQ